MQIAPLTIHDLRQCNRFPPVLSNFFLPALYSPCTYYFTDVEELNICDKQAVWAYIAEKRIELVVNCAAYKQLEMTANTA